MNRKVHLACTLNYVFENVGLLKIIAYHVRCKCGVYLSFVQHDTSKTDAARITKLDTQTFYNESRVQRSRSGVT